MLILQTSDFSKLLATSINTLVDLQSVIDRYEKIYIYRLLGADGKGGNLTTPQGLGSLFIADISGTTHVPVSSRFLTIFNAFITQDGQQVRENLGIKQILINIIYYYYVFESQVRHSQSGVITAQSENASVLPPLAAAKLAERKWNDILDSWDTIQWYLKANASAYPEYGVTQGIQLGYKFSPII